MRRVLMVFTLVVGLSLIGSAQNTSKKAEGQEKQNTALDGVSWVNSYSAFVREVADWSGDKPGATVIGINEGQFVPPERWGIMKKFSNQKVTWEGSFQGLTRGSPLLSDKGGERKEMDKVDLKLETAGFATLNHVFTKQTEVERWQTVTAGSRVSFRARVVGIGYFGPIADRIFYIFTLQDAELVKVLP